MLSRGLGVVGAAALLCGSVSADVVIDTIGDWDGQTRSLGWNSAAQVFRAPQDCDILESWTIGVGVETDVGGEFRFSIYRWDVNGNFALGNALFSTTMPMPEPPDVQFFDIEINAALTGGKMYAAVTEFLPSGNFRGIAYMVDDKWEGGYADFTNDPIDEPWSFGESAFDQAFRATFTRCIADCNDDQTIDSRDFSCFLNLYSNASPDADVNGDGVVDTRDFLMFLLVWVEGCPSA